MLSPDEKVRLLAQCDPQLKPLVLAALHTGFQSSELLPLMWEDVNFSRQMITVRAVYVKNGESRSLPMNKILTETLRAIRMNGQSERVVFCSQKGTLYRPFRTAFERAVRKAGYTDFTFHDLRHPFASCLVMAEVDLPTVKELMGYKHTHMTLRYTHLSSDHKQRAVDTLEQFVQRVPSIFTTAQNIQTTPRSQVIHFPSMPR